MSSAWTGRHLRSRVSASLESAPEKPERERERQTQQVTTQQQQTQRGVLSGVSDAETGRGSLLLPFGAR